MMKQILVIEDEGNIRENIVEMLEMEDYTVIEAGDGMTGIHLAQETHPDLILCDIMMPEIDGYDVLLELRSNPQTVTIPFVFLTALADRASNRQGMNLGADDFISKPFTPQELLDAINSRLQKHTIIVEEITGEVNNQIEDLRRNIVHALPHEIRTPLTGIIGCAEFLKMDDNEFPIEPDRVRNVAGIIERSAKRLVRLAENYLLYAQIEIISSDSVRIDELRQTFIENPGSVIFDIAHQRAEAYERLDDLDIVINNCSAQINEQNMWKIAEELIDNAFKFSPIGSKVVVRTEIRDHYFMCSITDQGRGMSAEEIAQVGAYSQFGRTLYEQQGVGLGLVIAKRLVGLHCGQLDIQSKLDEGSTFSVYVPLAS